MAPHFFLLFLFALSLAQGCIQLPEPARMADLTPIEEKGWRIFRQESCFSSCHLQTVASANKDKWTGFVPDLRDRPKRTRDWYLAYLISPRAVLPWSPMTSYGYLSRDEIEAVIAFLLRLKKSSAAPSQEPVSPKDIPETPRDLAGYQAGQAIYLTYCVGCHGESGNGGGPVGHLLSPEPRDFTDVIWMSKQTEAYLFSVTTNGKPDTAMPLFKEILSPKERASVIRYVEFFADPVARERMELGFFAKQIHASQSGNE